MKRISYCLIIGLVGFTFPAAAQDRGFVGVNFGLQAPAAGDFTSTAQAPFRLETSSFSATYDVKSGPWFEVGAGAMVTDIVGFGVAFNRMSSSAPASFSLTLPHPNLFNSSVTRSDDTERDLDHAETAFHLNAVLVPRTPDNVRVMIFGGPSYHRVERDIIRDIEITEVLLLNFYDFTIDRPILESADASAWGFNVGADVAVYLSDNVGVGGIVRFSRATVELKNGLDSTLQGSDMFQDVDAGGVMFGGGIRFRF